MADFPSPHPLTATWQCSACGQLFGDGDKRVDASEARPSLIIVTQSAQLKYCDACGRLVYFGDALLSKEVDK